jgi:hypothetical protein
MKANLGRLFEVGFNIGVLAYIKEHKLQHNFGEIYQNDLNNLSFPKMLAEIVRPENLTANLDIKIAEKWSLFFILKGFFAGLNFFGEYLSAIAWPPRRLKILYYQCSFAYQNSIQTYNKMEEISQREILSQLTCLNPNFSTDKIHQCVKHYNLNKGEFLQADFLMLLQYDHEVKMLCIDLSTFAPRFDNISEVTILRDLLIREVNYLRSQSIFANLQIDSTGLQGDFSEELQRFYTAFKVKDKETTKLIQAGSYSYSFYQFLQQQKMIPNETEVLFNVVGYSDRALNSISLHQNQIKVLETCWQIYKNQPREKTINDARHDVLNSIRLNSARCFEDGGDFIDNILEMTGDITKPIVYTETIDNFFNSIDILPDDLAQQLNIPRGLTLRNAHAQLIINSLNSENLYLFLTGNPGIGKTTAIANFLKKHKEEGFLFFYVSPRTQVNLDIIEKFKDSETGLLCDNQIFCINTNADIIASNEGKFTVNYTSNQYQEDFQKKTVNFRKDSEEIQRIESYQKHLEQKSETTIHYVSSKTKGVLNSISAAIYALINEKISHQIIATVAVQSLKVTENGKNTLEHFEQIFKDTYNKREGEVNSERMRGISQGIKNLFIMIDEITGDDSGVEFLEEISKIVRKYQLTKHGFNVKIIVADASIVDPDVIQQHLGDREPEPDKIYFKKLPENTPNIPPLDITPLTEGFQRSPAIAINTNSYPACHLQITYKVFAECIKFQENASLKQNNNLIKRVQAEIIKDIQTRLAQPEIEQMIVYIQDKRRLAQLIEQIQKEQDFIKNQDYLEINANLSEAEKANIHQWKNQVKVIFMTASASRGLSFPKTTHILVDIPRFEIEQNLMEVIQVIYRGRGEYELNKTKDNDPKELAFYLSDRVTYSEENRDISFRESKLTILNILLILKMSIMTRIAGYANIGKEKYLMIPIGGKSIDSAGESFSNKMVNLIKGLKSEHRAHPNDKLVEDVYTRLEKLFSRTEFVLKKNPKSSTTKTKREITYLELREEFNQNFLEICNPLSNLLNYGNLEPGYIMGSLLVVPIADHKLEENYQIRLYQEIKKEATPELLQKLYRIKDSKSYGDQLKSPIKGGAIELIKLLNQVEKSQSFELQSQRIDQYYAIPLLAFLLGKEMKEYFEKDTEEPEDQRLRDILSIYVRSRYPVGSLLPIGYKYKDFPFVVFKSYSLEQMRKRMFTDKYLLSSTTFNVLNLILSHQMKL